MRSIKKLITITKAEKNSDSLAFWISKTPEERVEAVEIIREHYYMMLGYNTPPPN